MEDKILVRFFWDFGRSGDIEGVFVCTKIELETAIGKEVYFGEILGKHSEVCGTLDEDDVEILSEDQDFIAKFIEIVGSSGYNPLAYLQKEDEE